MHWHMSMCKHSPTHKHKLSPRMEKQLCAVKKSADTCSGGCQNIVLSCKTISQDELPRVQSTVSVQARVNEAHWQRLQNPRKTCLLLVCFFSLLEEWICAPCGSYVQHKAPVGV